jgi:3-oxoadipate enol-lactonase
VSPITPAHRRAGRDDAPALLLGGSLGTTGAMWAPQLQALADRYSLITFDHRGHGASPVPPGPYTIDDLGTDVLALMDELGLHRVAYCGLSIGGMVGQWLGINAPERISALILLCTAAHLDTAETFLSRAAEVRAAGSPEPIADTVVGRWFTPAFAEAHPDVVARHRAMIAATPAEGYAACCEAIATMDLRVGLGSITAPTLVVSAAQDMSIPPEHGQAIATAVPGARYVELDPGAHVVSVERPEAVTTLIRDQLEEIA